MSSGVTVPVGAILTSASPRVWNPTITSSSDLVMIRSPTLTSKVGVATPGTATYDGFVLHSFVSEVRSPSEIHPDFPGTASHTVADGRACGLSSTNTALIRRRIVEAFMPPIRLVMIAHLPYGEHRTDVAVGPIETEVPLGPTYFTIRPHGVPT